MEARTCGEGRGAWLRVGMGVCVGVGRMTIGLEYGCKALSVRDQDVNIEMWDTVRPLPQQGDYVARGAG